MERKINLFKNQKYNENPELPYYFDEFEKYLSPPKTDFVVDLFNKLKLKPTSKSTKVFSITKDELSNVCIDGMYRLFGCEFDLMDPPEKFSKDTIFLYVSKNYVFIPGFIFHSFIDSLLIWCKSNGIGIQILYEENLSS